MHISYHRKYGILRNAALCNLCVTVSISLSGYRFDFIRASWHSALSHCLPVTGCDSFFSAALSGNVNVQHLEDSLTVCAPASATNSWTDKPCC